MDEKTGADGPPAVGIIMGSNSDWKTMRPAAQGPGRVRGVLTRLRSSPPTGPRTNYSNMPRGWRAAGLSVIIAGAGGAAHLPGMTASKTILPVVGVPVNATPLNGLDALLSIMQMPAEVGVATISIGEKGAENAAYFAAAALALRDPWLAARLQNHCAGRSDLGGRGPAGQAGKVVLLAKDDPDLPVLLHAEDYLSRLNVRHEKVIAGRAVGSGDLARLVADQEADGAVVFIAGSASGIGFASEVARATALPVLGVPIVVRQVDCVDDFLRPFRDMPPGVATFAVGRPGAINAALFAATIVSERGSEVWEKLAQMREEQKQRMLAMTI